MGKRVVGAAARKPPAGGRLAAAVFLCTFALHTLALAQLPGVRPLTPAEAEQERMRRMLQDTPKAYIDKVMAPGELPRAPDAAMRRDDEGSFRAWFSESRAVLVEARGDGLDLRSSHEIGQRFGYRQETLNYGDYELLADVRAGGGSPLSNAGGASLATTRRSQRFTLRNVGLPLTTRVFADTTAGDTFSEVTDVLARHYRLSLGARPVRGLGARVHSSDFDLRAGIGRRGNLLGGPFAGFEPADGELAWLGLSHRTPVGVVGLQYNRATAQETGRAGAAGSETVDSTAAAYRFSGELSPRLGLVARLTAIHSTTRGSGAPVARAAGGFAEAAVTSDNARQEFGAYGADPELRFGDARLYGSRGAYWRIDSVRSTFAWGLGAQVDNQVPFRGARGSRHVGLQANAQWQVDRRHAIGGSVHLEHRRSEDTGTDSLRPRSRSQYASAYYQRQMPRSGRSRVMLTLRRNQELVVNGSAASGEELGWEQEWLVGGNSAGRPELVTTLGIARDRHSGGVSRVSPTAGLRLAYAPAPRWNLSANLRYTSTRSNLSTTQGLSGYLDADYSLDNGWRVGAALSMNQVATRAGGTRLLPDSGPDLFRTRDTTLSLWARWDGSAGDKVRGLGGEGRSVGAGALQGRVFFDENRDGAQQSQEQGVPGVEVILDARFRTTTDNFGRFFFPLVSTGVHEVAVREDSVPLPWGAPQQRPWRAEVPLRGQADVSVPVVKVGE